MSGVTITSGTSACPARRPMLMNDTARPRLRMNQLPSATVSPRFTPVSAAVLPTPKNNQNCHTSCMTASPSNAAVTIIPATTTAVRAPYRSSRCPTAADPIDPPRLPMVNAMAVSQRAHPNSSSMGVTNTDSTGPYIDTCANVTTTDVPTIAQP